MASNQTHRSAISHQVDRIEALIAALPTIDAEEIIDTLADIVDQTKPHLSGVNHE